MLLIGDFGFSGCLGFALCWYVGFVFRFSGVDVDCWCFGFIMLHVGVLVGACVRCWPFGIG